MSYTQAIKTHLTHVEKVNISKKWLGDYIAWVWMKTRNLVSLSSLITTTTKQTNKVSQNGFKDNEDI